MAKATKGAAMTRLHAAARLARTALAVRLLEHGFYAGQEQIMIALGRDDGQTPGQLAGRLGVRPPTITKTINRLQVQGFVEKRSSESDARQAHVFLTEKGSEAIDKIEKSVRKALGCFVKDFVLQRCEGLQGVVRAVALGFRTT